MYTKICEITHYGRAEINTKKGKEAEEKRLKDLNKNKRIL